MTTLYAMTWPLSALVRSCLFSVLTSVAAAQAVPPSADPRDVSSIDAIVRAMYRDVSGPQGQKHNWKPLRSLFTPGALMGSVWRSKSGEVHYTAVTVKQYIAQYDADMTRTGYFEKERQRNVAAFGNIAHVFSSYESRSKPSDAKPEFRGVNSLQLMFDGKRWWVTSIQWQSEDEKLKLPKAW